MDIHSITQELKTNGKSINNIPLRVTFYARVSSESDEQLNSLDNQVKHYREYIGNKSSWTYIEGYIDEGLSGMSTKKRENFHRMIEDAKAGKFDLIVTKEITRFARNTLDSILYTRELFRAGVGVLFENDSINTLNDDSELHLTIMSGIAQDDLRKHSTRIQFGHQQAIKNGIVLGNNRIFGYVKHNKHLAIDEEEAVMVRELFNLYSTDKYSMKQIETLFWEKGYRNRNGKKIAHTTMAGIIANPKYKGYYVGNKVKVIDMFTKKQKFLPPEEWVMFKDETGDIVPAIVSEEVWDKANEILNRRSADVKKRQNKCNHGNLLTGKLICTDCGVPYYRRDSKDKTGKVNSKWVCSGKINNGADSCTSVAIYEEEIKPVLFDVFKETEADAEAIAQKYIEMYRSISRNQNTEKQILNLKNKIEMIQKKKSKLLEYNVSGQITDKDFIQMNKQCAEDVERAEKELFELEEQQNSREDLKKHIDKIRSVLEKARRDAEKGIINKEFVENYIDKIFVTPEENMLKLEIKIFTGETTQRFLEKLERRSGNMFKKMIQAYEQGLK